MNILVNAANIKIGGGMQVADSFCRTLQNYPTHNFVVILSTYFNDNLNYLDKCENIELYRYDLKLNLITLLTGRDKFLDNIVTSKSIDVVINIFGPCVWSSRCKKISGFARAHLVMPESPYYQRMPITQRIKEKLFNKVLYYFFNRSTDVFFTENPLITKRVSEYFKKEAVTITNYYNQVFDNSHLCNRYELPPFNGITLLTISSYYPHKNLEIALDILEYMERIGYELNLRFVFTIKQDDFKEIPEKYKRNFLFIGKVDVNECPSLYEQSDIVFQPTLLECFTATYPEAMKMGKPIVTTDLHFARGLCDAAALYYEPLNAEDAASKILQLINEKSLYDELVCSGKEQLKKFDDYNTRSAKLIRLCESKFD